jgi:hypothetical protein
MRKRFKSKSNSISRGIQTLRQSQQLDQLNFVARTVACPFFRAREFTFRGSGNPATNRSICAVGRRQASAIFAATIVSESQHTTTATLGGKYAKQK